MSQGRSDPPADTEHFATQRLAPSQGGSTPAPQLAPSAASTRRCNLARDVVAAVLLLIAPLFPWNLYFGLGIPHSSGAVFALLIVATLLSLSAIAATYASGSRGGGARVDRLRLALNAPYALLIVGFVGFDVVQSARYGGSASVPGGIGPGAWLGTGGALLSGQPLVTGTPADERRFRSWLRSARIVGYASIVLAALSFLFNLFWRTKAALPTGSSGFGKENAAIIVTAIVYGMVALAAVVVASRWILLRARSFRLATIALGASTLAAGVTVWLLPAGREIDGFHGIAQNTTTAGVGFEGYLVWAAAATIFAPLTLLRLITDRRIDRGVWRAAARKALLLIVVWCLASVLMRVTDIVVAAVFHLSRVPYDSAAMAAFDVVTAVLAIWLRLNLLHRALPVAVISSLCGVLLVFSVSRIVVGVALAPRLAAAPADAGNTAYGNDLAQQITSTFDVVLACLALCILAVAVSTARGVQRRPHTDDVSAPGDADQSWNAETTVFGQDPAEEPTDRIRVPGGADATGRLTTGAPRIFRSANSGRGRSSERPVSAAPKPSGSGPRIYRQERPTTNR